MSFTFFVRPFILYFLLITSVFLVFFNGLFVDFVPYDTADYLLNNSFIFHLSWQSVWHVFSRPVIYFMPITWASHMLDYYFYGVQPFGHHLTNLILHLFNTCFVFLLIKIVVQRYFSVYRASLLNWVSFGGTLLWAIHPLRVEAVLWIANRKGLMVAFWSLLVMICYLKFPLNHKKFYVMLVFLFVFALSSHAYAVTLPCLFIFLDCLLVKHRVDSWLMFVFASFWRKIPFFVLSLIWSIITVYEHASRLKIAQSFVFSDRFFYLIPDAFERLSFYLVKTCFPTHLRLIYPYIQSSWLSPIFLWMLILFLFIFGFSFVHRSIKLSFLAYLVFLLPVLGFVQSGVLSHADRWSYLSTLSFYVLLTGFLYFLLYSFKLLKPILVSFLITGCFFCFVLTKHQLLYWQDFRYFLNETYRSYPNQNAQVLGILFNDAFNEGLFGKAQYFLDRLTLFFPKSEECLLSTATILFHEKKYDQVKTLLSFSPLTINQPIQFTKCWMLACVFYFEKDYETSRLFCERIIHYQSYLYKKDIKAISNVLILNAFNMKYLDDFEQAEHYFRQAYALNPQNVDSFGYLVGLLYEQKRYKDCLELLNYVTFSSHQYGLIKILSEFYILIGKAQNDSFLETKGNNLLKGLKKEALRLQALVDPSESTK